MSNVNEKGSSAGCLGIVWIFCVVMFLGYVFDAKNVPGGLLLIFGGLVFAPILYMILKDKWEKL
jgi:hypothetical protein